MARHIVVAGAGIGGLGAALGFARAGHRVTLLDREPLPPTRDPEQAFADWRRPSVPQGPQPHSILGRTRTLLLEHAPDVVEAFHTWGAGRWNGLDGAHASTMTEDDERCTGYLMRRLCFESILRSTVEREERVGLRTEVVVDDLEFATGTSVPQVIGVRLRGGEVVIGDLVIDACGRKTPMPWVLARRGIDLQTQVSECNTVYYSRYFRRLGEPDDAEDEFLSRVAVIGGDLGYLAFSLAFGEHRTVGCWLVPPPWDERMKELRHAHVWDAVMQSIPSIATWADPQRCEPLTDVMPMGGHQNLLRSFHIDGSPLVLGLLPVGDALCTTNPFYGWGISLALTHAFAAVDAASHRDVFDVSDAYFAAICDETRSYFRLSSDQDRLRTIFWKKGDRDPSLDVLAEQLRLLRDGLRPAAEKDVYVARVLARRGHLVDPVDAIWSDERAIATAREVAASRASDRKPDPLGPTRDELLEVILRSNVGSRS